MKKQNTESSDMTVLVLLSVFLINIVWMGMCQVQTLAKSVQALQKPPIMFWKQLAHSLVDIQSLNKHVNQSLIGQVVITNWKGRKAALDYKAN